MSGERVDSLVRENVLLLKLDVEGFEPTAFQSSQGLLKNHRCVVLQKACCCMKNAAFWLRIRPAKVAAVPMLIASMQGGPCHYGVFSRGV